MFLRTSQAFLILSGFICLYACASPKAPTGGPKDETPPAIIEAGSTPNHQTNFHEKEIFILFNEWVTLNDIYANLVVSPLMPHNPDIRQKGKGIIIKLPDSLREETTYSINFGNAIADFNEGNILENYAFVFSTGDILDSLKLTGNVTNAATLKPAEGVWVMLYPTGQDSAVYKRKPEYLAKTNKDGNWSISNIREDSFAVVALKDDNQNFLYDQDGELFGWLPEKIYTSQPTAQLPGIRVFPKENRIAVKDVLHVAPGWIKAIVDSPYPKPVPQFLPAIDSSVTAWDGDTLQIWYKPSKNYSGYAVLEHDSTQIKPSAGLALLKQPTTIRVTSGRLRPGEPVSFVSAVPLISIDTGRILLHHDSLGTIPFMIMHDSYDARRFSMKAPWVVQMRYKITFFPGALHDYWGRTNDTLQQSVVITSPEQYGDLTMTIDGLDSTKQYIILIKEGEQISETFVVNHQSGEKMTKKGLTPGKYTIEMIEDTNRNGIWDTGNYYKKIQPERKMIFMPENLRANWELEVKMTWKIN